MWRLSITRACTELQLGADCLGKCAPPDWILDDGGNETRAGPMHKRSTFPGRATQNTCPDNRGCSATSDRERLWVGPSLGAGAEALAKGLRGFRAGGGNFGK